MDFLIFYQIQDFLNRIFKNKRIRFFSDSHANYARNFMRVGKKSGMLDSNQ